VSADLPENRAVIDRIDAGIGVLLIGPAGDQHEVDASLLPEGARDGDVIEATVENDIVVAGPIDRELTDARRTDAQQRLSRIRKGRGSGRFS
jgi:hypothetical protein